MNSSTTTPYPPPKIQLIMSQQPIAPDDIDRLARKRAGAKLGWYTHAIVFTLVNLLLFGMSQYGFGHRPWSLFPLMGWGLGLALHGIAVFVLGSGSNLRERMVQKERERLERERAGR
jgi:hypothetical protein